MENSQKSSFTAELRRVFWPIEWHENKKFLPMAAMMFCILFNYSTLRSIKDGFVVTGIGPEAISFLKTYVVLPSAVIMMVVYAKLCNIMSPQKVFYTIAWFFSLYLVFFAFVLYPYPEFFHPNHQTIEGLVIEYRFIPVICIVIFSNILVMFFYFWMNKNVLTDPRLYDSGEAAGKPKKKKTKLSLGESFKMIFTSKYLGLLVTLILAYGISINLVEGVWKAKLRELYPTKEAYTMFMGNFQAYQGVAAIIFMLVGSNILRRVSWATAAIFTPLMILVTGIGFFSFIIFDQTIGLYFAAFFGTGPLALAVIIGTAQNVLSKATKYSLFDSTKEMAYIPLDDEMKTKGKAAVDVIGGRFGKSGGGIIQSTFFILLPTYTFAEATPYFAGVFFVIVILWIFAVQGLSKEYQKLTTGEK